MLIFYFNKYNNLKIYMYATDNLKHWKMYKSICSITIIYAVSYFEVQKDFLT